MQQQVRGAGSPGRFSPASGAASGAFSGAGGPDAEQLPAQHMEDTSSPTPTVEPLSNTVVMTKVATVALGVTTSNRAAMANLKADMAADSRLLLGATEAADMSNSMATAATEDDLLSRIPLGYRNVTCFSQWREAMEGV